MRLRVSFRRSQLRVNSTNLRHSIFLKAKCGQEGAPRFEDPCSIREHCGSFIRRCSEVPGDGQANTDSPKSPSDVKLGEYPVNSRSSLMTWKAGFSTAAILKKRSGPDSTIVLCGFTHFQTETADMRDWLRNCFVSRTGGRDLLGVLLSGHEPAN